MTLPKVPASTLNEVTRLAHKAGLEQLMKDRVLEPFAEIVGETGQTRKVQIPNQALSQSHSPSVLFQTLARLVKMTGAAGFVTVIDSWTLYQSEDIKARLQADTEYRDTFHKMVEAKGVAAIAEAGYGRMLEAVAATGQTPDAFISIMQPYERVTKGGVIPATVLFRGQSPPKVHTIRLFGEATVVVSDTDGGGDAVGGRILSLYQGGSKSTDQPQFRKKGK